MIENMAKMEKHLGIILDDIAQYYPRSLKSATYVTHQTQVAGVRLKYQGKASHGNMMLQRLINLRVAFSIPNRLFLIKNPYMEGSKAQIKRIKAYLNAFLEFNNLSSSLPKELARESELQGQVAVRLVWDDNTKLPILRYYPWEKTDYTVKAVNEYDVNSPLKMMYKVDGQAIELDDNEFEFIAFNDELGIYEGYPTCGPILKTIENLDKDLQDWRKLNHLFAHPTPHFHCETKEEALAINALIKSVGWKVGTALATNSDFSLKGVTGQEGNILMLSIQTNVKVISAHTGVGPHFLGFANIMSGRSTAESIGEPTEVSLFAEITGWKKFYINLFNKVIRMRNKKLQQQLQENLIHPKLIPLTDRQWKHIKEILMPAAEKGLVSREFFLNAIPDIDVDTEKEKIIEEEKTMPKIKKEQPNNIQE